MCTRQRVGQIAMTTLAGTWALLDYSTVQIGGHVFRHRGVEGDLFSPIRSLPRDSALPRSAHLLARALSPRRGDLRPPGVQREHVVSQVEEPMKVLRTTTCISIVTAIAYALATSSTATRGATETTDIALANDIRAAAGRVESANV